jgi:uncharacterized membrane protein YfbV (UPF0208 family)
MNMSVIEIIKLGHKYLKLWPEHDDLVKYFADYSAIMASRFVCRVFPALAVTVVFVQLYLGSVAVLGQALMYGLFIISMPIQALVMLGVKADKQLPPSLASWYREAVVKLKHNDAEHELSLKNPRYLDLALLLNITYRDQ